MDKLLELEKKLREAQAELNKIMSAGSTVNGSVASTGGPSIASQIGFGKADGEYGPKVDIPSHKIVDAKHDNGDEDYDYVVHSKTGEVHKQMATGPHKGKYVAMGFKADQATKSEKHDDEKEDKKLIAEAIDEHNEKKHGEDKDEDSAFKEKSLKKEEKGVHSSVGEEAALVEYLLLVYGSSRQWCCLSRR
jgi:hypothetical protein